MKIRKSTRGALAGVVLAIVAIYALARWYAIPGSTLLAWLFGSVALIPGTMLAAIALVFLFRLAARLLKRIFDRQA